MKILLSAFEAFGGESVNPAREALERINDGEVIKLVLPVEYEKAAAIIVNAIDEYKPDAVISLGQAGGRSAVTPEKYAVNERSAAVPDAAGRLCSGEKIDPNGEDRMESNFGAEEIVKSIRAAGLPAEISESAGTYVCNDVMYSVLSRLKGTNVPAGFIHVPYCTEQLKGHPDKFAMDISDIVRAVEIAVGVVKGLVG